MYLLNCLFVKYKDEHQKSKWTIECRIFISFIWHWSELWTCKKRFHEKTKIGMTILQRLYFYCFLIRFILNLVNGLEYNTMNRLVKMMVRWKANVILNVLKNMADLYEWLSLPLAIFQKKVFLTTKSNPFCTVMISKYLVFTFTLF